MVNLFKHYDIWRQTERTGQSVFDGATMRWIHYQKTFMIVSQSIMDESGHKHGMYYSLTAGHIDLADIRQSYKQEGYCAVDNVYSAAELDEMESFFEDVKSEEHKAFGNEISTDES